MKKKSKTPAPAVREPSEDEIRDYAFHLYEQSGRQPGHDVENWLEAKACLEANVPRPHAHARLHRHRHPETADVAFVAIGVGTEAVCSGGAGVDPLRLLATRPEL
jgi:hypothetical protein